MTKLGFVILLAACAMDSPTATDTTATVPIVTCDGSHVGSTRVHDLWFASGIGTLPAKVLQRCVALQDTFYQTETMPARVYGYAWVEVVNGQ